MLPLSHGNYQQYLTVNTSFISLTSQQIRNVTNVGLTLGQRRRCWAGIKPASGLTCAAEMTSFLLSGMQDTVVMVTYKMGTGVRVITGRVDPESLMACGEGVDSGTMLGE